MNAPKAIPHSIAVTGEVVTTRLRYGGIGLGYLFNGHVYKTTGSYWAVRADVDMIPMISYVCDGGREYLKTVRGLVNGCMQLEAIQ